MIIVLRGVPGSGKSTLARALAPLLNAVILDKDALRACLFPADTTEYTTTQDDFVIGLMLQAARYHLTARPHRPILLDGRVFATISQIEPIREFAASLPTAFRVIECRCSRETALQRITADVTHPAKNRNAALLDAQIAKWQPLPYPVIIIDTEQPIETSLPQALSKLTAASE